MRPSGNGRVNFVIMHFGFPLYVRKMNFKIYFPQFEFFYFINLRVKSDIFREKYRAWWTLYTIPQSDILDL